jgi:putative hydrolase of the HAD superfamily
VWLLGGVALVTLSGCRAAFDVVVTVDHDGSGVVATTTALDAEAADRLLDLDLNSAGLPLGDLAQSGWVVGAPQRDTSGGTVITASKDFGTAEQFREVMAELNGENGLFRDFTLTRTKNFARVDYAVSGRLDTTAGFTGFSDLALEAALGRCPVAGGQVVHASAQDVDITFDVVLPGEIQEAGAGGVVKTDSIDVTEAQWQVSLADGDVTPVGVSSATRRVGPRVLRGVAVVTGVMAALIVFARLLRILLPDRRRRPPRRHGSDIRPVAKADPPELVDAPLVTKHRVVVLDGMGVLYREPDDVANMLIPFARQRGSTKSDAEIEARVRWLRLGRITSAEFWPAIGVQGQPDELDTAYLSAHQLSPGVIKYLRTIRERGVRVACATNDSTAWAYRLRASHSLETLIEKWVISGSVGVAKPDPALFEVLRRVLEDEPSAILLIDDSLDVLDAARARGFATAWFSPDGTRSEARDHTIIHGFELADDELIEVDQT